MSTQLIPTTRHSDRPGATPSTDNFTSSLIFAVIVLGLMVAGWAAPVSAQPAEPALTPNSHLGACSTTAFYQLAGCRHEAIEDLYEAWALCLQVEDNGERSECNREARNERDEALAECRDVFDGRREVCDELGEEPYDPDFDPTNFDDDFSNLTSPNSHYPLAIGNTAEYTDGEEIIMIEVLNETKSIEGVTCIVVRDLVIIDGLPLEDTDDWFAMRTDGTVDYCGEISLNYEVFDGDDPQQAELVDIDGSWKAGRDAFAGTLFPGAPVVGELYRQEFAPGEAEDVAMVVVTDYGFGNDPAFDVGIPEELADLLCDDDCIVTKEFTPLEPGVFEYKYYAPGIGVFAEVGYEDDEFDGMLQIVGCNYDPRCDDLPEFEEEEEEEED